MCGAFSGFFVSNTQSSFRSVVQIRLSSESGFLLWVQLRVCRGVNANSGELAIELGIAAMLDSCSFVFANVSSRSFSNVFDQRDLTENPASGSYKAVHRGICVGAAVVYLGVTFGRLRSPYKHNRAEACWRPTLDNVSFSQLHLGELSCILT